MFNMSNTELCSPLHCLCVWQADNFDPLLVVALFLLFSSFMVMIYYYRKVIQFTNNVANELRGHIHQRHQRSAMKLTRLFIILTVLFAFNWSFLLFQWVYTLSGYTNRPGIDILSSSMATANSVINPFMYAIYNKVLWGKMKDLVRLECICGKKTVVVDNNKVKSEYSSAQSFVSTASTVSSHRHIIQVNQKRHSSSSSSNHNHHSALRIPSHSHSTLAVPSNKYLVIPNKVKTKTETKTKTNGKQLPNKSEYAVSLRLPSSKTTHTHNYTSASVSPAVSETVVSIPLS